MVRLGGRWARTQSVKTDLGTHPHPGIHSTEPMNAFTQQSVILERVAQGDKHAMRELLDQYTGLVWSLVRRKIANADDAEDIVQEVFAEIWKSAHRYKPELGSEATFISVITRRRVIDAIRRITRRRDQGASSVPFDGLAEYSASADGSGLADGAIEQAIDTRSELAGVMTLLESLNPQRRSVIELSIIHGLSHSQIVEATELPLGTVKAHIRRGLEEVRAGLRAARKPGDGGEVKR